MCDYWNDFQPLFTMLYKVIPVMFKSVDEIL